MKRLQSIIGAAVAALALTGLSMPTTRTSRSS